MRYLGLVLNFSSQGVFSIRVQQDVMAGEQVFLNYGSKSNERMLLFYGFVDPPPFGMGVVEFNERSHILDGDCSSLLTELRRVCDNDETSVLLMMNDLLRERLGRMSSGADAERHGRLANYVKEQRAILLSARSLLFGNLLGDLWHSKVDANPSVLAEAWDRRDVVMNDGDILVEYSLADCVVQEEEGEESAVVAPVDVPIHSENWIVVQRINGDKVQYLVEGTSGRVGGTFLLD